LGREVSGPGKGGGGFVEKWTKDGVEETKLRSGGERERPSKPESGGREKGVLTRLEKVRNGRLH